LACAIKLAAEEKEMVRGEAICTSPRLPVLKANKKPRLLGRGKGRAEQAL
jgi:hypothetical protein